VPRVGSTSAGDIAVGIERDPQFGLATQTVIVKKNPFFQTDYKLPANLEWKPVDSRDREWRYTNSSTFIGTRPEEYLSFGRLLIRTDNDQAINATVGSLFIDVWAEFAIPR
jgi:hypothetical protein